MSYSKSSRCAIQPPNSIDVMSKWTDTLCTRRLGVTHSIYLVMIMNTMNALAQEPVSYHTVRIDNLDIFYRASHEAAFRKSFLSLETTRNRHLGASPHPERINPDTWTDEYYFLNQPGQADIQTDLFFDYQNNLKAYPAWQKWLRDHQPPMLVLWGRYDSSFLVAGAEAYQQDVPGAEVHILDAGHFALDEQAGEVIRLTAAFMQGLRETEIK